MRFGNHRPFTAVRMSIVLPSHGRRSPRAELIHQYGYHNSIEGEKPRTCEKNADFSRPRLLLRSP
ncbi:MAG: hypothetical protein GPJ02_23750 [Microcystis aeruginosa G13-12]|nr:hypothetical protein [Microcystis aeruginosa G13-12]NCS19940.1 hypothetical protein [Microcystis aeruginosa G11-06]NCT53965.1 hypothetical protein [Microcystis aeruginosa G13-03]